MNLGEIRSRVYASTSTTSSDVTTVNDLINEALRDFVDRTGCLQDIYSITLTAGDDEYDLPTEVSDLLRLRTVKLSGGSLGRPVELQPVTDLSELAALRALSSDNAEPTHFAVIGFDTLLLWPPPSAGLTLVGEYEKRAPELSADVDVPAVREEYHQAIVDKATELVLAWDRQPDAGEWRERYELWVARCKAALKRTHGIRPKALRPSTGNRGRGDGVNYVVVD